MSKDESSPAGCHGDYRHAQQIRAHFGDPPALAGSAGGQHPLEAGCQGAPRLTGLLTAAGLRLIADLPVTDPATLPEVLERALALSPDLLIFGGGDGSVATAADFLAYRDVALGVLALGTTNNFARSLRLPLTIDGADRTIATGKVADVDLGRVSGAAGEELFANLASLGLSIEVAHRTPHVLKRRIGRAAYALTGLRVLPRHRPFLATVTTAAGTETFWAPAEYRQRPVPRRAAHRP